MGMQPRWFPVQVDYIAARSILQFQSYYTDIQRPIVGKKKDSGKFCPRCEQRDDRGCVNTSTIDRGDIPTGERSQSDCAPRDRDCPVDWTTSPVICTCTIATHDTTSLQASKAGHRNVEFVKLDDEVVLKDICSRLSMVQMMSQCAGERSMRCTQAP